MTEVLLDFDDSCVLMRAETAHVAAQGDSNETNSPLGFDQGLQATPLEGIRAEIAREHLELDARIRLIEYGSIALLHQKALYSGADQRTLDTLEGQLQAKLSEYKNSLRISADIAFALGK